MYMYMCVYIYIYIHTYTYKQAQTKLSPFDLKLARCEYEGAPGAALAKEYNTIIC